MCKKKPGNRCHHDAKILLNDAERKLNLAYISENPGEIFPAIITEQNARQDYESTKTAIKQLEKQLNETSNEEERAEIELKIKHGNQLRKARSRAYNLSLVNVETQERFIQEGRKYYNEVREKITISSHSEIIDTIHHRIDSNQVLAEKVLKKLETALRDMNSTQELLDKLSREYYVAQKYVYIAHGVLSEALSLTPIKEAPSIQKDFRKD